MQTAGRCLKGEEMDMETKVVFLIAADPDSKMSTEPLAVIMVEEERTPVHEYVLDWKKKKKKKKIRCCYCYLD